MPLHRTVQYPVPHIGGKTNLGNTHHNERCVWGGNKWSKPQMTALENFSQGPGLWNWILSHNSSGASRREEKHSE